jgi:hypothetical protein
MKIDTRIEPKQRPVFFLLLGACVVLIVLAVVVGYRTLTPPPLQYPPGFDPKYGPDMRYLYERTPRPGGPGSPMRPGSGRFTPPPVTNPYGGGIGPR